MRLLSLYHVALVTSLQILDTFGDQICNPSGAVTCPDNTCCVKSQCDAEGSLFHCCGEDEDDEFCSVCPSCGKLRY